MINRTRAQNPVESDGFINPPCLPKPTPHARSITLTEKVQATKLMLCSNQPWDAAKSYGKALPLSILGRTVSFHVEAKEGLRLVYEGKFRLCCLLNGM